VNGGHGDARKELAFGYVRQDSTTDSGPERALPSNCPPGRPCQAQIERPQHAVRVLVAVRQKLTSAGVLVEEITFEPRVRVDERR
jgi:hypothetical protein